MSKNSTPIIIKPSDGFELILKSNYLNDVLHIKKLITIELKKECNLYSVSFIQDKDIKCHRTKIIHR